MTYINAFILGIVEGITEFIPVSSTGHLILAGDLLGFNDEKAKVFEVFIQLGAILSVAWLYRDRIISSCGNIRIRDNNQFLLNIFIAFLPSAFFGILTHPFIKYYLFSPMVVVYALVIGGIIILIIERLKPQPKILNIDNLSAKTALGIGIAQVFSLIPGVSRAGATIMGGLCLGLDRKTAAEFSFFLAIPTMFAAASYDLFKNFGSLNMSDAYVFAVGFLTAFFSAMLVIKAFIKFIETHNFNPFAYYRIIFGMVALIYYL